MIPILIWTLVFVGVGIIFIVRTWLPGVREETGHPYTRQDEANLQRELQEFKTVNDLVPDNIRLINNAFIKDFWLESLYYQLNQTRGNGHRQWRMAYVTFKLLCSILPIDKVNTNLEPMTLFGIPIKFSNDAVGCLLTIDRGKKGSE